MHLNCFKKFLTKKELHKLYVTCYWVQIDQRVGYELIEKWVRNVRAWVRIGWVRKIHGYETTGYHLHGNLIDGLGNPEHLDSATNKKYVNTEDIRQDIAIADKADKSYVDVEIAKVHIDSTPLLLRDGSRSMTGDLDMDENHILSVKNLND